MTFTELMNDKHSYDWYQRKYKIRGRIWRGYVFINVIYKYFRAVVKTKMRTYLDDDVNSIYNLLTQYGYGATVLELLEQEYEARNALADLINDIKQ